MDEPAVGEFGLGGEFLVESVLLFGREDAERVACVARRRSGRRPKRQTRERASAARARRRPESARQGRADKRSTGAGPVAALSTVPATPTSKRSWLSSRAPETPSGHADPAPHAVPYDTRLRLGGGVAVARRGQLRSLRRDAPASVAHRLLRPARGAAELMLPTRRFVVFFRWVAVAVRVPPTVAPRAPPTAAGRPGG
jgi:hypothetical protein